MKYVLQLLILVVAFDISTARALDRIRLAQAVPGQIVTPGLLSSSLNINMSKWVSDL
jgi:hypothetical protein